MPLTGWFESTANALNMHVCFTYYGDNFDTKVGALMRNESNFLFFGYIPTGKSCLAGNVQGGLTLSFTLRL